MKRFTFLLIVILLSCSKKKEETPQPINKNIGYWVGFFDGKKSSAEIREKNLIIDQNYFNSTFRTENEIVTNQTHFDNKATYLESVHYVYGDTLYINLQLLDKKYKTGKYTK